MFPPFEINDLSHRNQQGRLEDCFWRGRGAQRHQGTQGGGGGGAKGQSAPDPSDTKP